LEQEEFLAYASFDSNFVNIHNIRNISYSNTSIFNLSYYNKKFDLNSIDSLYFVVEYFTEHEGVAHTFLSFGFNKSDFVSISVEIRKEKGEIYSPYKGLINEYELMYVVGDENDLIKLRTNFRNSSVFLYPIDTTSDKIKLLFVDMLSRANKLKKHPEFYNTIFNTCTTNLLRHANKIRLNKIVYNYKIFLPGYSDELLYDLDLIVKKGNFSETKEAYQINDLGLKYSDPSLFSLGIRGLLD